MKNKDGLYAILYLLVPLVLVIIAISSMSKEASMEIREDAIILDVPTCSKMKIKFNQIEEIEFLEDFEIGKKTKGTNDSQYSAGYFKNDIESNYFAFIYNKCDSYIKITTDKEIYVINDETDEKTNKLLEYIENNHQVDKE